MTTRGMGPALLVDGGTDTAAGAGYGEQVLAPALRPGQIVVMDNVSAHTGERIQPLLEARGWTVP